ncbi:MAG TPA: hypothetical protein VJZ76_00740 [Thermoanaerobaculia bacterium]|nr:hypothetical protein [Thermoanaerobaculia bacterium]
MVLIPFLALLLLGCVIAFLDWRRGWYLAIVCGVLQDPVRKMTTGTPVVITFSVVLVYLCILLASHQTLRSALADIGKRFAPLYLATTLFLVILVVAAINGLITYGFQYWKAPALSFIIYMMPIPALLLGYSFYRRDEDLVPLIVFYSVLTSVALIGVILEYQQMPWSALGLVAATEGANVRMLPGIQLTMLAGFYRGPDILAWHAATLAMIGIAMALRARVIRAAWPWIATAAWGVLACFLSGRRKALYMLLVFAVLFVWRYMRRLTAPQAVSFATMGLALFFITHRLSTSERTDAYVRAAATTQNEIFRRLEGGLGVTIEQSGIMGAGLGTATQGTQHFTTTSYSWQEGGLSKLAIEVGVPGVILVALLLFLFVNYMLKITRAPDEPGTSQLLRCMLMAMVIANVANFTASAQAYSDPLLTLMTAFFGGCLLATAATESRIAATARETTGSASGGPPRAAALPA